MSLQTQQKQSSALDLKLAWALLPQVPLATRVTLLHILGLSESSKYLDLRTDLAVAVLRSFLTSSKPQTVTATQKLAGKDPGIQGRLWVSKVTAPAPPETGVRDAVVGAIESLKDPDAPRGGFALPDVLPVEAEWTGYRAAATKQSQLPAISEKERYAELMKECKTATTVLYLHGGAYFLLDPATYRPAAKKLAKLTGGRCYSVRYRLAPQCPFPAALVDALSAYMTLLYPPPESFHEAVRPEHIVFAGDSAGGNLSAALLQTILELRRQGAKISWFGEDRDIPLPAGVAVCAPWLDITRSSPSIESNARYDYLPTASQQSGRSHPPCGAWPADPPRRELYVDDDLVAHPLVTLLMARSWAGAPPVYLSLGWELLADEVKFWAAKLRGEGVTVVLEEYEAMPHVFTLLFPDTPSSRRCMERWAGFMARVTQGPPAPVESSFVAVKAKTLAEERLDPDKLAPYTEEEIRARILDKMERGDVPGSVAESAAAARL